MANLTIDRLKDVANDFRNLKEAFSTILWDTYTPPVTHQYDGKLVPKGRPRVGKGGRVFTPAETREAEARIRKWGLEHFPAAVTYPLNVELTLREPNKDPETILHGLAGLTYNNKGDVDNYAKLIFDALNGVVYKDDRQIVRMMVQRRWARTSGFVLRVSRGGLNKSEYVNFLKLIKR